MSHSPSVSGESQRQNKIPRPNPTLRWTTVTTNRIVTLEANVSVLNREVDCKVFGKLEWDVMVIQIAKPQEVPLAVSRHKTNKPSVKTDRDNRLGRIASVASVCEDRP